MIKDDGSFDEPDWDAFECVYRKSTKIIFFRNFNCINLATTTECWDCTTTSKYIL